MRITIWVGRISTLGTATTEASVDIEDLTVIAGGVPPRALRLVVEWARQRQPELRENWDRARRHEPLKPIDPLR
jgi:hypothetical protein